MNKYPNGVRAFKPKPNAPSFIVSELIITPEELVPYMDANPDMCTHYNTLRQIKLQITVSKDGNSHSVQVNTFKPTKKSDLPF